MSRKSGGPNSEGGTARWAKVRSASEGQEFMQNCASLTMAFKAANGTL